ncbi:DUF2946 domain-containing protein [Curvibacter sp. APW13]|uniref:DUF2946 domain-containing protein n=1 Tax=Curvibacter sp. APW13 TaxID=3077236 RepID=UPI0028DE68B7|nr:DUF2946 domain-containing protein [Curvibacter sp. APW13]MDT8990819.1 DUF2946 domain-containing protein [Curvibacter sp. APW13]
MLLQTLRQSRTLARWVLVWFVMAMGVAVAAPTLQPISLDTVCSAAAAASTDEGLPAAPVHHTLQCVMCLGLMAPPAADPAPMPKVGAAPTRVAAGVAAVQLAPRNSPLVARAPPRA